ncbi:MAG: N-6 DNA methylase [Verrucomicrobia bacterium]|nr:N-6 DNA methylase [Verrucomicrobiota bacterium]
MLRNTKNQRQLTLGDFLRTLEQRIKCATKIGMANGSDIRTCEVTFCSRVAGWLNALFAEHPEWPFRRAEIEESRAINRKRSDLRVYGERKRLILAGEVKLPGVLEGRTPYHSDLVEDSARKADSAGAEFFFTWNVNLLVLFDRKKWHLPLMERRVQDFELGLALESRDEVDRPEVEAGIKKFLAEFLAEFAEIALGRKPEWGMRLDQWFIRSFEHHILWPVELTRNYLSARADTDKTFDHHLQEWISREHGWLFTRNDPVLWREVLDRAARTLCYVFANRLIFYGSVRAKFAELDALSIPKQVNSADHLYDHFQKAFQRAVEATGDYETLFYPYEKDWAAPLIFAQADSVEAWRSVIANLEPFNFKLIPTDILGGIFRRLIDPAERRRFGQIYTNEDLVDVVNAFCIRSAEANVLDPAAGSGSFVVRAYHRKAWLKQNQSLRHPGVSHQDWLRQIYAVDISLFAAHLCTLNLAARDIRDEENYPRVRRGNFFEVAREMADKKPFCLLPEGLQGERRPGPINLPPLAAIVGNPPYVRQEWIPKRGERGLKRMQAKEDLQDLCAEFWPGLKLSGRSDLHCYFWPAATKFLKEGGWFGFLTSSSWLDVEYGFALQEWILKNFRIYAIFESNTEPWFEDARVKTCAVILQKCSEPKARDTQLVRFVRLDARFKDILGERPDENARQTAAEKFRDEILACKKHATGDGWRLVVKKQGDLWQEGLRAGRLFEMQRQRDLAEHVKPGLGGNDEDDDADNGLYDENGNGILHEDAAVYGPRYGGGKWGKYLRAPNFYFHIMERYGDRFVPLGEIATIRRGITSGCDAFFMPRNVSAKFLEKYSNLDWNDAPLMTHCQRVEVESGKVKLIEAGDGTVHPVEAKYLAPEVHSLMSVSRPLLSAGELDRLILLVSEQVHDLKGTYVLKYLRYGEKTTFASKKSKAVPVSLRSTCAAREPWYDLTRTKRGHLVWPKSQQYRHVIVHNRNRLIVNCNLYDVTAVDEKSCPPEILAAVLNSTLVALTKIYFGRYAGTEGNLKTEVVDVNLLEVPDPRRVTRTVAKKLQDAFARLCQRDTGPMVEAEFMDCHSTERAKKLAEKPVSLPWELQQPDRRELDLAVFELLGVADAKEGAALCDELYRETAAHFRQIRVVEIQKQEQRARAEGREFRTDELAADLWDALTDGEKQPLTEWLAAQATYGTRFVVPEGKPHIPDATDFLDANTVFFRQSNGEKPVSLALPSRSHAEMVFTLARLGFHGAIRLPETERDARELGERLVARLASITERANHLARSRTSDERRATDLAGLLQHWMIYGKPTKSPKLSELGDKLLD